MKDPTRDDMLAFLQGEAFVAELDDFAIEEAIYWFASDHHGGQWSNLYAALCASLYLPGPITSAPSDPYLYDTLVSEYVNSGE